MRIKFAKNIVRRICEFRSANFCVFYFQNFKEVNMRTILQSSQPVQVRLPPDLVDEIDGWRRGQKDLPTRPGAIRDLLTQALKALKRSAENTA
jgi:hypothetical protein